MRQQKVTREEWLAARRTGIGGTDVAAILGVSRFAKPIDVYNDKAGIIQQRASTDRMRSGLELEAVGLRRYAEHSGATPRRVAGRLVRMKEPDGWAVASPDAICGAGGNRRGIEVKTVGIGSWKNWKRDGEIVVPLDYQTQVTWYAKVTGIWTWDFVVLMPTMQWDIITYEPDREYAETCFERARRFYFDHVVPKVPPPLDASAGSMTYLQAMHKKVAPGLKPGDEIAEGLTHEYCRLGRDITAGEERQEEVKTLLCGFIGTAEGVTGEKYKATWKPAKAKVTTDWEGVARAVAKPERIEKVLPKFMKTGEVTRRFHATYKFDADEPGLEG